MAYAFQYNPDSAPVPNRITRFIPDCQPMDWSSKPNTLIDPPVSPEASAANYADSKWDGSTVVRLTAEELALESEASRVSSWANYTVSYYNSITNNKRRTR